MARHGLYAVFSTEDGKACWGMTRNKRTALATGRQLGGEVRRMDLPDAYFWDAPTFRVCSDLLADYRAEERS